MGALTRLTETFRKKAFGVKDALTASAAAMATVVALGATPTPADAQVTEADVDVAFELLTDYANYHPNITENDGGDAGVLYVNIDRFFLDYPAQGYRQSETSMRDAAIFLAQAYGLEGSTEYRNLMQIIDNHSGIAHAFEVGTGQSLQVQENPLFDGGKYQAVIDVQYRAAEFLELVATQYESDPRVTQDEYVAFGQFCYIVQEQGREIQHLFESVNSDHGRRSDPNAMTVEDGSGAKVTCPTPGQRNSFPRR